MSALSPRIVANVRSLAQWVSVAGILSWCNGLLLLLAAVLGVLARTMAAPEERGPAVGSGSLQALLALLTILSGFMLRRYAMHLRLAAERADSAPIVDGAAYEMGYWRLTGPAIAVMLVAAGVAIYAVTIADIPAIASVTDAELARISVFGDVANLAGIALGVGGLLLVLRALRPATR